MKDWANICIRGGCEEHADWKVFVFVGFPYPETEEVDKATLFGFYEDHPNVNRDECYVMKAGDKAAENQFGINEIVATYKQVHNAEVEVYRDLEDWAKVYMPCDCCGGTTQFPERRQVLLDAGYALPVPMDGSRHERT